ncbi:hypothetical protein [Thalassotalea agarivorans]|uniref:PEP-CTERM protein-sorting domain-containing protein n=1 Tax=Thalassotalea agarivorans TaxID=349064 RepID=A0A1I0FVT2_THASX|nr:hypothetical protein [Thalassotalea agarivorans]SET62523.1 PEP-CTERM protein-sorting domain-containing protein [Thalassotalea agarivorans]
MKFKFLSIALLLFVSNVSNAGLITLDFEGAGNFASIDQFYNGGTDSLGNAGDNLGVNFSPNALSLIDFDAGGSGNFSNNPSGDTILFFTQVPSYLNYEAGFTTGMSFYYAAASDVVISVFDGLNGSGNLLASISFGANNNGFNCDIDEGYFCQWDLVGLRFDGLAKSVDFSGGLNQAGFDDVTLGALELVSIRVPEPSTLMILLLTMVGLVSQRIVKVK